MRNSVEEKSLGGKQLSIECGCKGRELGTGKLPMAVDKLASCLDRHMTVFFACGHQMDCGKEHRHMSV